MGFGDFFKGAGSGLISGGLSLLGGIASSITGKQANDREYERQKEFAQNGIRWRVEDAKAAGIHPIFAIGSNTTSYSPQAAVGTDMGLSSAGQNISRAIEAKQTREERQEFDDLQKELIRSQINRTNAETRRIEDSTIDDALRFAALSAAATRLQQRVPSLPSSSQKSISPDDIGNIKVNPSEIVSPSTRWGSHSAGVGTVMTWKRIGSAIKPTWQPDEGDAITEDLHMSATAKARYALDALNGKVDPPPLSEWPPSERKKIMSGNYTPVFEPFMFEWVVKPSWYTPKKAYRDFLEKRLNKR